jgi:hypothetical protein
MTDKIFKSCILLPLLAGLWAGSASAAMVGGVAVDGIGSETTTGVSSGSIEYFIPLKRNTSGVYGAANDYDGASSCANGTGTCSDSGYGFGYNDAGALTMNIFFDLAAIPTIGAAQLDFWFADLDLQSINDPNGFFESVSLSLWDGNGDGSSLDLVQGTVKAPGDITAGTLDVGGIDPITWSLDLAALGFLDEVENSRASRQGLWVQLGFGSYFSGMKGKNTPEYLQATLEVSPVPIPSALWLFGSALVGFIGMSRRTRV